MLINLTKKYIRERSFLELCRKSGITRNTWRSLLRGGRIQKDTLDRMYNFFDLPVDEFYIKNLSSRYTDRNETIETTIKVIRVYLFGMTTEEFAKMLGMSKRSIERIERGELKEQLTVSFFQKIFDKKNIAKCRWDWPVE